MAGPIESAAKATRWTVLSAVVATVLQVAQTLVLARLLLPADFGKMAILNLVLGFAQIYADMGISNAIIFKQTLSQTELSSLYWANVGTGLASYLVLAMIAPAIARFYSQPELTGLLYLIGVVCIISPLGFQFQTLLQKELRFKALAGIEMVSKILGFATCVILGIHGLGVISLVAGAVVTASAASALQIYIGRLYHRPQFRFAWMDIKGLVSFGLYQLGERSLNYFNGSVDKLIIGRLIGVEALGYYNFANSIVVQPLVRINPILTKIAFPLFAKLQGRQEAVRDIYLRMVNVLTSSNTILLSGLIVLAPLLVPTVFGREWTPSVFMLQLLAVVAILRASMNPIGSLLLAHGRTDIGFKWNCVLLVSQGVGVVAGALMNGSTGVVTALVLLHVGYFIFSYRYLVMPLLGPCGRLYTATFRSSAILGVATALVALATCLAVKRIGAGDMTRVTCGAIVVGAIAAVYTIRIVRKGVFETR